MFVHTRENISLWYQQHPNKHNIRNYKYRMSKNHMVVLSIDYQEVSKIKKITATPIGFVSSKKTATVLRKQVKNYSSYP